MVFKRSSFESLYFGKQQFCLTYFALFDCLKFKTLEISGLISEIKTFFRGDTFLFVYYAFVFMKPK